MMATKQLPEKRQVFVQVNVVKIGEIDIMNESFTAEVTIKSRWREKSLDGQENVEIEEKRFWNPRISIDNAIGQPRVKVEYAVEPDESGEYFLVEKKTFRGIYLELMELEDFPFDVQELSFMIKSETSVKTTELVEDPLDLHKMHKRSFMDEQEYYLYKHISCSTPPPNNDLHLGIVDKDRPMLKATLTVARLSTCFVWNIFVLMAIIVIQSFSTFGMELNFLKNRLQLSFVVILTAVTFKNMVNSNIPKISHFTYIDKYLVVMCVVLVVISGFTGVMSRLAKEIQPPVEYYGFICLVTFFLSFHVVLAGFVYFQAFEIRRRMSKQERLYEAQVSAFRQARLQADQKAEESA